MQARTTRDYLLALKDTITRERQQAINLNLEGMYDVMREKEELIRILAQIKNIDDEDKPIAEAVRHENRRNAFLFKATLGWIKGTMEFFGKKTSTSTYSANADSVGTDINGRLLSGKV